jgi:hypothetical protein
LGLIPATFALSTGVPVYLWWDHVNQTVKWTDVSQVASGIAAFLVLFWQWRRARQEASLEKFYDRLDMANKRMVAVVEQELAQKDPRHQSPLVGVSIFGMWVFAELDNLEYAIEKYRLGYMSGENFDRAVATFESRCKYLPGFGAEASDACASGYQEHTAKAIKAVLALCAGGNNPVPCGQERPPIG